MPSPPILGADIELGNAWTGNAYRTNLDAASRVVREVDRIRALRGHTCGDSHPSWYGEWGRHWLTNGGCLYVDMAHIELCTPETAGARDHAAAVHAMLRIVRACRRRVQSRLPDGEELFVNVHVSDGTPETSWGAHQNVAIPRTLWDDIFDHRRPHVMALLASLVAALVPVFGQGLILALKHGCRYATSARAHHLGSLVTLATTEAYNRGLLNRRDEPHADDRVARLHLIAFDANLMPATILMRSGLIQLVVTALDQGWFNSDLLLDDPVAAVGVWSLGFCPEAGTLRPPAVRRPGGSHIGLFEWHRLLLADLRALIDSGHIPEAVVPEGGVILDLWAETLDDLVREDIDRLATRLDWALKWRVLSELRRPSSSFDLDDPRLRLLDQHYGHVDDRIGLFWRFWREGLVERVIDDQAIGRFITAGDPRTRSGLRGELVRRLGPWIANLDWSYCEIVRGHSAWSRYGSRRRIALADPSAPSGSIIDDLRTRFPDDAQLLEYLIESPVGSAITLLPAPTNSNDEEMHHDLRALPSPSSQ